MHLRKKTSLFTLVFLISISIPAISNEQDDLYGPRLEVGLGGLGSRMQSRPEWVTKYYISGLATASYRIIKGLSIQGGVDAGHGEHAQPPWIDYGPRMQVSTDGGSYMNGQWAGLRYDVPLNYTGAYDIHTVYLAGGITRYVFGVKSNWQRIYKTDYGWENNEVPEGINAEDSFKMGDLRGYYLAIAARWRFSLDTRVESDSWLGAYGVDVGIRYVRHNKGTLEYDNLDVAKDHFNSYQVFAVLFLKLKLLY